MTKITSPIFSAFIIILLSVSSSLSAENGPTELVLESTIDLARKSKPAFFPHGVHQNFLQCSDCHHSQGDDGKQVAYTAGMKIYRCESCHNRGIDSISQELNTFKKAAHELCKGCHTKRSKTGEHVGPTECNGCHRKDLE